MRTYGRARNARRMASAVWSICSCVAPACVNSGVISSGPTSRRMIASGSVSRRSYPLRMPASIISVMRCFTGSQCVFTSAPKPGSLSAIAMPLTVRSTGSAR